MKQKIGAFFAKFINFLSEGLIMEDNQRLTVDVPIQLHREFKDWCVLNGKKMNDVIRELLRETISSSEDQLNRTEPLEVPYNQDKVLARN